MERKTEVVSLVPVSISSRRLVQKSRLKSHNVLSELEIRGLGEVRKLLKWRKILFYLPKQKQLTSNAFGRLGASDNGELFIVFALLPLSVRR